MPSAVPPDRYAAQIVGREWLSAGTFFLHLSPPAPFSFHPGQRIRVQHGGMERDYSIISPPLDDTLSLCVRKVDQGPISTILSEAPIGTIVYFRGPFGYFGFRASSNVAVFVATGTGIAPFISMTRAGVKGMIVLHGVKLREELIEEQLFREGASCYVPCLSTTAGGSKREPHVYHGRVTEYLRAVLPVAPYDFYLCGRSEMVRDAVLLIDERFPGSLVYSEIFY